MLTDLEAGVDRTETKLNGAMRRMRKFIRQTEGEFMASTSPVDSAHDRYRDQVRLVYRDTYHRTYGSPSGCHSRMRRDY